jgi:DNA repair exonuclease SbcCD ATPase subunit
MEQLKQLEQKYVELCAAYGDKSIQLEAITNQYNELRKQLADVLEQIKKAQEAQKEQETKLEAVEPEVV